MDNILDKISNKEKLSLEEANMFLNFTVSSVRRLIADFKHVPLEAYDFKNMCDTAQAIIANYFGKLGIFYVPVDTQKAIDENVTGHRFILCDLGELYLVDPTYMQFLSFPKDYIFINNKVVVAPGPAYLFEGDSSFISDGFMPLNLENAHFYGDSFYKTTTGVLKDIVPLESMKGDIYIKSFLKGVSALTWTFDELEKNNLVIKH